MDDILDLINQINTEINTKFKENSEAISNKNEEQKTIINEVFSILIKIDEAINDILSIKTRNDDEKEALQKKLQELIESKKKVMDALTQLKDNNAKKTNEITEAIKSFNDNTKLNNQSRDLANTIKDNVDKIKLNQEPQPPTSQRDENSFNRNRLGKALPPINDQTQVNSTNLGEIPMGENYPKSTGLNQGQNQDKKGGKRRRQTNKKLKKKHNKSKRKTQKGGFKWFGKKNKDKRIKSKTKKIF